LTGRTSDLIRATVSGIALPTMLTSSPTERIDAPTTLIAVPSDLIRATILTIALPTTLTFSPNERIAASPQSFVSSFPLWSSL
jgi:hypothetical protein